MKPPLADARGRDSPRKPHEPPSCTKVELAVAEEGDGGGEAVHEVAAAHRAELTHGEEAGGGWVADQLSQLRTAPPGDKLAVMNRQLVASA